MEEMKMNVVVKDTTAYIFNRKIVIAREGAGEPCAHISAHCGNASVAPRRSLVRGAPSF